MHDLIRVSFFSDQYWLAFPAVPPKPLEADSGTVVADVKNYRFDRLSRALPDHTAGLGLHLRGLRCWLQLTNMVERSSCSETMMEPSS